MGLHRLKPGLNLIDRLSGLGEALGYYVQREYPIDEGVNPPAVDIALSRAEGQPPIFMIEVESKASNAMASNALKVLGRKATDLAKPLYFFHVVVAGGTDSNRPSHLADGFAHHNYGVYLLAKGQLRTLLIDLIRQHHVVSGSLDVARVLAELDAFGLPVRDLDEILATIEVVGFDADFGTAYLEAAKLDAKFETPLARELARYLAGAANGEREFLSQHHEFSYASWGAPDLVASALLMNMQPETCATYGKRLRSAGSDYLRMSPQLDPAYIEFLMDFAPLLMAFLVVLCRRDARTTGWLASELVGLFQRLRRSHNWPHYCYTAAWSLHVLAALQLDSDFETLADQINAQGGLPSDVLLDPPACVPLEEQDVGVLGEFREATPIPRAEDLRSMNEGVVTGDIDRIARTEALRLLTENSYHLDWSKQVLRLLYSLVEVRKA